ncbi:E4 ORF 2 [Simian adenovirus 23]|uniref:E4 ORF 2 n=1 Tax=Simian adenovirus 23 TaxID=35266 RepID=Q6QPC0_9ADEN|nr:E4 ORF 2 [Simian adenovirus 23]
MLERTPCTYSIVVPEALNVHLEDFSFVDFLKNCLPDFLSSYLEDITGSSQHAYFNLTFGNAHWGGLRFICNVACPSLIPGGPMAKNFGDDMKEYLQLLLREELRDRGRDFDIPLVNLLQVNQEQNILEL